MSQTGLVLEQASVIEAVHWTHWFVVVLQAGADPVQRGDVSSMHGMQSPALAPVAMQCPALHWAVDEHVPWPRLMPQTLSTESHAPDTHTATATELVQAPSRTGVCPLMVGSVELLVSRFAHSCDPVLQNCGVDV